VFPLPTALPKAAITKLKFLKETHKVTEILTASEIVFYICFLIKKAAYANRWQLNCYHLLKSVFSGLPKLLTKSQNNPKLLIKSQKMYLY